MTHTFSDDFAVHVPAALHPQDYATDHYYREGTPDPKTGVPILSDCTWYAAAALRTASNGRIDLLQKVAPWGNGGEWAKSARAYLQLHKHWSVLSVDKAPQAGDVIEFAPPNPNLPIGDSNWGHVAFVEKVVLQPNAHLAVTISEESYTGDQPGQGATNVINRKDVSQVVDPSGRVRRWQRTILYPVVAGTDPPQVNDAGLKLVTFIHFNY